jgi:hypothetical protein
MNKLCIPAVVIAVLLLSSTAHAQQTIGSTTSVTPSATGSYGGNQRTLQTGASVYHQDNIQTGDAGRTAMRFHDNSNLQVGPKSSVKLDKFVYDPNKSAASVAVEAARGSFRFTTGQQNKGSYQVKTPYGTLGIRG